MPPVPKLEDFKAPWETEGGEDAEIDKVKLKKYIHGLLNDKDRLQANVTTVTTERDALKATIDEAARKDESEVDRLKREKAELEEKVTKGAQTSQETLQLRVAIKKGLSETQAKRLIGSTEAELEADADALLESFGGNGNGAGDNGSDDGARRQPRRVRNGNDPDDGAAAPVDIQKAIDSIPRIN